jgi:SOS-response transcriptional repressor LexA
MSKNSISLYENGDASPSMHQMAKIADAFGVSLITFFNGPPGFETVQDGIDAYDIVESRQQTLLSAVDVPMFSGVPTGGFEESNAEGVHRMPEDVRGSDTNVVLRVNNGSMYPTLIEGDLVLVDTNVKKPKSGAIVCAVYNEEPTLARFVRQDRRVGLVPDNPRYESQFTTRPRDILILGQVIRLIDRDAKLMKPSFPV